MNRRSLFSTPLAAPIAALAAKPPAQSGKAFWPPHPDFVVHRAVSLPPDSGRIQSLLSHHGDLYVVAEHGIFRLVDLKS